MNSGKLLFKIKAAPTAIMMAMENANSNPINTQTIIVPVARGKLKMIEASGIISALLALKDSANDVETRVNKKMPIKTAHINKRFL